MQPIKQIAPNHFVFISDEKICFQSYNTIVCTIDKNTEFIRITYGQPQSKTTAKYLNKFLQMFTKYSTYKEIQQL